MKDLATQYETYNLCAYPQVIQQIISSHKAVCFQRAVNFTQRKLILAFEKQGELLAFNQSISPEMVDTHYDHIFYFNKNNLDIILQKSEVAFKEEFFVSKEKPGKIIQSPKGVHIHLTQNFKKMAFRCIRSWFDDEDIYWLNL